MEMNAREIAYNILYEIYENGAFSNIVINKYLCENLNVKDEGFIREIVYGVLENELYIDYIISKASKIKLNKIHEKIIIILRIGVYQLIFMDRVPDSAAVNESVKIAKIHGHKGTIGYVNGVLRNISRNKENMIKIDVKDKVDYISIKYSHPKWMVERWVKEYGEKFTEELCIKNNEHPDLNIRVNTLKIDKENLKNQLENKGLIIKDTLYSKDSLIIENPEKITELNEFKEGLFIIQDESSALVSQILDPKPGSTVIDLCSAPGGKATHLAQMMDNKGTIIALDIFQHKIDLINDNAKRLGIDIIQAKIGDALNIDETLINFADYILVDAPCSGLGIIRRKPDIKRNRRLKDINELSKIQYKILENAKEYLKVGGILVYSTCTIEKEENNNLINKFLNENHNFKLVSINNCMPNNVSINTLEEGYIQLFPNTHNTDGFYIAKMIKER